MKPPNETMAKTILHNPCSVGLSKELTFSAVLQPPDLKLNRTEALLVGIYRGVIILGISRWCEMDFIHSRKSKCG